MHPFEIAHRYTAGIPQNIRYGEDTLGIDNSVGLPGGWPVCPFAKNLGLNLLRIFLGDLVFNGRGDGNVARLEEHVAGGHLCSASGTTLQRLLLRVHPVNHFRYVEALLVVEPAADISQPDDFVPGLLHQLRRHRADIAKTLHDHAAALFLQTNLGQRLVAAHHHAAARGFAPSAGSTQLNRLSCHHRRRGLPHVHRVGIHHPRHRLFARTHVRRGDVSLGSEPNSKLRGIAPRQALQFSPRQFARVANHSPFRAPERNVHHRAFPRHPRRQRAHFIYRNVRSKANPALSRSAHVGMQHPVAGKNFQLPVIHPHRDVQRDFLARPFQETVQALLQAQLARRHLKTRFRVLVDIHLFRHHGFRHAKLSFADFHILYHSPERSIPPCSAGNRVSTAGAMLIPFSQDKSLHNSSCECLTG